MSIEADHVVCHDGTLTSCFREKRKNVFGRIHLVYLDEKTPKKEIVANWH